jgi:hypothetical protein
MCYTLRLLLGLIILVGGSDISALEPKIALGAAVEVQAVQEQLLKAFKQPSITQLSQVIATFSANASKFDTASRRELLRICQSLLQQLDTFEETLFKRYTTKPEVLLPALVSAGAIAVGTAAFIHGHVLSARQEKEFKQWQADVDGQVAAYTAQGKIAFTRDQAKALREMFTYEDEKDDAWFARDQNFWYGSSSELSRCNDVEALLKNGRLKEDTLHMPITEQMIDATFEGNDGSNSSLKKYTVFKGSGNNPLNIAKEMRRYHGARLSGDVANYPPRIRKKLYGVLPLHPFFNNSFEVKNKKYGASGEEDARRMQYIFKGGSGPQGYDRGWAITQLEAIRLFALNAIINPEQPVFALVEYERDFRRPRENYIFSPYVQELANRQKDHYIVLNNSPEPTRTTAPAHFKKAGIGIGVAGLIGLGATVSVAAYKAYKEHKLIKQQRELLLQLRDTLLQSV